LISDLFQYLATRFLIGRQWIENLSRQDEERMKAGGGRDKTKNAEMQRVCIRQEKAPAGQHLFCLRKS
jgi:hypothetical protein